MIGNLFEVTGTLVLQRVMLDESVTGILVALHEDGTVHSTDATPTLGLYDNLEFKYYSRVSQDKEVWQ